MEFLRSWSWGDAIVLLVAGFMFYAGIYLVPSDVPDHSKNLLEILEGRMAMKPHFLYYVTLAVFSGFIANLSIINAAAVFILTIATWFRYRQGLLYFQRSNDMDINSPTLIIAGVCSVIVFSLPVAFTATMNLGQISPNVWHNSTWTFSMVFSIWMFFLFQKLFEDPSWRLSAWTSLAVFLCVSAKPNFFMVLAPVVGILALIHWSRPKSFLQRTIPLAVGSVTLILQFLSHYGDVNSKSHIVIAPFEIWTIWSDNIPLSLTASILAPVLMWVLLPKESWRDKDFRHASMAYIVGLMMYVLFAEHNAGGAKSSGNFGWGLASAACILFLVVAKRILNSWNRSKNFGIKEKVIVAAYALHVLTGIVYILKYPIFGYR